MERCRIYFLDYPEDIFADYYEFSTPKQAAEWFNPLYQNYKVKASNIEVLRNPWDVDLMGNFSKGYKITSGEDTIWVRITKIN